MRRFLMTALVAGAANSLAVELFVAPYGDDANPGTVRQPLQTLEAASKRAGVKTVYVRGGMYRLSQTLKLGPGQSGSTWRAYKNEKPIITGAVRIEGFARYKDEILKAPSIPGVNYRQLFFDGKRMHLARYPNFDPNNPYGGGWAYADGQPVPMYKDLPGENRHTLRYKDADARNWSRPWEGEVFVFPRYNWWNNIVRIKTVDRSSRTITLAGDCSYPIRPGDRYYVRGLFEELDAPGEWYLDQREWTVYFWPPAPLEGRNVYAPRLRTLLEITDGATNIVIRGFTFECCEGTAIVLKNTTNCLVAACTIRNVGDYNGCGVVLSGGARNGVVGCDIYDVGSHGIVISGGDRITLTPAANRAENNYIHHVGVFYKQGTGIAMSGCGNRASHNLIHDCPRMGIIFSGNNLVIEYNRIRHVNLETDDTGVVYTGGRDWISSRGTLIRYNFFHDSYGYGIGANGLRQQPHMAWGVYLDDNAGGVDVIGNIVARCSRGLVHLHNARDNRIENNILVDGALYQLEANGWTPTHRYWTNHLPTMIKGYESVIHQSAWQKMRNMHTHPTNAILPNGLIMSGNVVCRNIFYYHNADAKLYSLNRMSLDHNFFDSNIVWHANWPILTGYRKIKAVGTQNLISNGGFEDEEPGRAPANWKWQVCPTGSKAAIDGAIRFSGKQSLRIEGRGTTKDVSGRELWPNYVSTEISAKPGQWYQVSAYVRAETEGTQFAMMAQSYLPNVLFWSRGTNATAGTEWRKYEVVFKFPAPGDRDWREQIKSFCVRFDTRQPHGTIWVDNVEVSEAVVLDEWASWQAMAQDVHSLVADPLFVNPGKDDYRLRRNSPAFKLGFKPIPVEKIGPYKHELRATWPIKEADGAREHAPVAGP